MPHVDVQVRKNRNMVNHNNEVVHRIFISIKLMYASPQ